MCVISYQISLVLCSNMIRYLKIVLNFKKREIQIDRESVRERKRGFEALNMFHYKYIYRLYDYNFLIYMLVSELSDRVNLEADIKSD